MAQQQTIVAVLGTGLVPHDAPVLRADDLGVLRGEGVFETMHVREGKPWLLEQHLARLGRSAQRLDLPLPPVADLAALVGQACTAWSGAGEAAVRLVCTRGPESGGPPTVFTTVKAIAPSVRRARGRGLAVLTAPLGVAAHARVDAPWLLAGAKTLSYAINMATQRWGLSEGADDVLWVSSDGYALEAPTSTLVWLHRNVLCTVPPEATGVLPGTTAAWLFDRAGTEGWTTEQRMVRPDDLMKVDGAWLTSSVRGAVEIRSLNGVAREGSSATGRIVRLLGFPTGDEPPIGSR